MKISVLCENTANSAEYGAEHGLSLFIEKEGLKILFDMGQTDLFYKNAVKLDVDLSKTDIAIISHGHYDHGGGLSKFLEISDSAPIYVGAYAFDPHYNGSGAYNGLDVSLRENSRLIFNDDTIKIREDIILDRCPEMKRMYPFGSFGLKALTENGISDDDFRHEQYLILNDNGKRILISGCSHRGILNILEYYRPDILIGGFHLFKMETGAELISIAEKMKEYGTEFYTCHCTGEEQYDFIKDIIPRLHYISSGDVFNV